MSEPPVPGGRRADLAIDLEGNWTYVEVKTRNVRVVKQNTSFRKNALREMLRLRAHSVKQLPRKQPALAVLSTSTSIDRGMAANRIAIARAFGDRFFDENSDNIIGVIIIAPFRNRKSRTGRGLCFSHDREPEVAKPPREFWQACCRAAVRASHESDEAVDSSVGPQMGRRRIVRD
jgi:hypothetical protein